MPLVRAFEASTAGLADEPFAMPIHGEDQMVIRSHPDRTMVTFSLLLQDPSEVVLGKVFLQELFDTRQKHTLQNAPVIIFGKEPPAEVAALVPARPQSSPAFFSFGTSDEQQPVL